jgi:F-type H+-transporting ATPase subunit gamma
LGPQKGSADDGRGTVLGVVGATFGFNVAVTADADLVNGFLSGDYDEVTSFIRSSSAWPSRCPVNKQLLPIPAIEKPEEETETEGPYLAEHICEPVNR